ncbi:TetR-like C-terminal domain-containing protein, partial [Lachnoanaerobaculum sp.]
KNKDMSKIFLHEDLEASFSSELRSKLRVCVFNKYKAFIKQKNMPYFELYYDFIISGTVGLLVRWVDSEFEMSPHELAVLTNSFIQSGLTNIIA